LWACAIRTQVKDLKEELKHNFHIKPHQVKWSNIRATLNFDNQNDFISFLVDIIDFLAPDVLAFLHKVQRIMQNNIMSPEL